MTLYEIRQEISSWVPEVNEETGELINALEWDSLQMAYEEKVENIACYVKNLVMLSEGIKAEETALSERRKAVDKKISYLKQLLTENVTDKFVSAKCAVSFRTSESVEITDEWNIPSELMIEKVTLTPDKKAIKELLKQGETVSGAVLKQSKNVQIK